MAEVWEELEQVYLWERSRAERKSKNADPRHVPPRTKPRGDQRNGQDSRPETRAYAANAQSGKNGKGKKGSNPRRGKKDTGKWCDLHKSNTHSNEECYKQKKMREEKNDSARGKEREIIANQVSASARSVTAASFTSVAARMR